MARAAVEDPIKVFRFRLAIDGFQRLAFAEVAGIDRSTEVVNYREGGDNTTVKKSAGLTTFPDITLRRGQIINGTPGGAQDFYDWAKQVFDVTTNGNAANYRKDIDIIQLDHAGAPVRKWRVREAFVVGFKPFSDMNGQTNENSMEELRIAHEGWEAVPV
jgi:phage tail-like protein